MKSVDQWGQLVWAVWGGGPQCVFWVSVSLSFFFVNNTGQHLLCHRQEANVLIHKLIQVSCEFLQIHKHCYTALTRRSVSYPHIMTWLSVQMLSKKIKKNKSQTKHIKKKLNRQQTNTCWQVLLLKRSLHSSKYFSSISLLGMLTLFLEQRHWGTITTSQLKS